MKKYMIGILIGVMCLCGCEDISTENSYTQTECDHDWGEVGHDIDILTGDLIYNIRCTKCKMETNVNHERWIEIK